MEKNEVVKKERSSSKNLMEISAAVTLLVSAIIFIINSFLYSEILYFIGLFIFAVGYQLGIRIIIGNIIPRFKSLINVDCKWFKPLGFEGKLYKKLNVKKWKNKAPVYEPEEFDIEKNSIGQIVINMCNAEIVHEFNILGGYLSILFSAFLGYFGLFLALSIIAGAGDLFFIVIQRYNRPRVLKVRDRSFSAERV